MKKFLVLFLTAVLMLTLSASITAFASEDEVTLTTPEEDAKTTPEKVEFDKEEKKFVVTFGDGSVVKVDAEAEKTEEHTAINIKFTTDNISTSLMHMGIGMLGVIMVLGLIGCVVFILNKVFKPQV